MQWKQKGIVEKLDKHNNVLLCCPILQEAIDTSETVSVPAHCKSEILPEFSCPGLELSKYLTEPDYRKCFTGSLQSCLVIIENFPMLPQSAK